MSTIQTNLQSAYTSLSNISHRAYVYVSSQFPEISALVKSSFSYVSSGVSSIANKSYSWIKVQGSHAAQKAVPLVNTAKMQLFQNKKAVFGGVVVSIALYVLYYFWKNLPQQPIVKVQSTLNISQLSISVPKEMHDVPDVTMTFCLDTSGSMTNEGHSKDATRIQDVQHAMIKMLKDAQERVDAKKAFIKIATVTFTTEVKVPHEPHSFVPLKNTAQKIIDTINELKADGNTDLFLGLETALTQLKKMAKSNSKSRHLMILITDGDDNPIKSQIKTFQEGINSVGADFFAIGVGKTHNKGILKKITDSKVVKGATYIDTTTGLDTIDSAITKIYEQALSTFNQVELTCPTLQVGTWTVPGYSSTLKDGLTTYDLGSLTEGTTRDLKIEINGAALSEPLDLKDVKFLLTFTDPKGKKGRQSIPWQANTVIDPVLLR